MDVLYFFHKIVVYRHFSYFQYGFQNGRQRSRDYFIIIGLNESFFILATFCESFTAISLNGSGDTLC